MLTYKYDIGPPGAGDYQRTRPNSFYAVSAAFNGHALPSFRTRRAVHEIGHTLPLMHCDDYCCAMAPSHRWSGATSRRACSAETIMRVPLEGGQLVASPCTSP